MLLSKIFTAVTAAALFGSGNAVPMIQNSALQARNDFPSADIFSGVQNLTALTSNLTHTVANIASYNVLVSLIGIGPLSDTTILLNGLILSTKKVTALINGTAPGTSALNGTLVDQIVDCVSEYAIANQHLFTTLMSKAPFIVALTLGGPVATLVGNLGAAIDLLVAAIIFQMPTYAAGLGSLADALDGVVQSTILIFN